jgi:hypothetical protein
MSDVAHSEKKEFSRKIDFLEMVLPARRLRMKLQQLLRRREMSALGRKRL